MIMAKPGAVITDSLRLSAFISSTGLTRQLIARAGMAPPPLDQPCDRVAALAAGRLEAAAIDHDRCSGGAALKPARCFSPVPLGSRRCGPRTARKAAPR